MFKIKNESMNKLILSFSIIATQSFNSNAQNVNIPDANFKAYLVGQSGINLNMDSEIQVSEASVYNGSFTCNTLNITDLTGIEAFTELTGLYIFYNPIASMDLSQNTNLTALHCYINQLTALDVSANTALTELRCERNQITSLDVSALPNLTFLTVGNNELTSFDVSNNLLLDQLDISNSWASGGTNQITSIDVSNNVNLTSLGVSYNPITSLDVSNNINLEVLYCDVNGLTSLNVSMLPNLTYLSCSDNDLTSLDVSNSLALTDLIIGTNPITGSLDLSNHSALKSIVCSGTQISALNIANGNNTNFTYMWATETPNLTCVEVDDAAWSTANWNAWNNIDAGDSYSEDCSLGLTDNNLIDMNIYPNPASSVLSIETEAFVSSISIFNVYGKLVQYETSNSFSIEELPTGVYMVNIVASNGIQTLKFIKE